MKLLPVAGLTRPEFAGPSVGALQEVTLGDLGDMQDVLGAPIVGAQRVRASDFSPEGMLLKYGTKAADAGLQRLLAAGKKPAPGKKKADPTDWSGPVWIGPKNKNNKRPARVHARKGYRVAVLDLAPDLVVMRVLPASVADKQTVATITEAMRQDLVSRFGGGRSAPSTTFRPAGPRAGRGGDAGVPGRGVQVQPRDEVIDDLQEAVDDFIDDLQDAWD